MMTNNMATIMGLDLSLTATGIVVLKEGTVITKRLVKTKPQGNLPLDEIERLLGIKEEIRKEIKTYEPELILIENLAFMARNTTALVQLAGLNYMVREMLAISRTPFVMVAPSTLKKFATGKGNGPKDIVILETYKNFNVSFVDNNLCDAYVLSMIGCALKNECPKKLTVPQKEVLKLLGVQYQPQVTA